MKAGHIAGRIDHTNLDINASIKDISKLCEEAALCGFRAVCVRPDFVKYCYEKLDRLGAVKSVNLAAVVGFPKEKNLVMEDMGKYLICEKVEETGKAVYNGANEIDLVVDIERLAKGDDDYIFNEIFRVVKNSGGNLVKTIVETCYLDRPKLEKACDLIIEAGAGCIKTSTGYADRGGAEESKIKIIKEYLKEIKSDLLIKASGGIKDYDKAIRMIEAGADILGVSSGVKIYKEAKKNR